MSTDFKEQLLKDVLASYKDEYKELIDVWKQLDLKAQGTITVCGVFLAGIFAFSRDPATTDRSIEKWLVIIATALLVLSVIAALAAIQIRPTKFPPVGSVHDALVTDWLGGKVGFDDDQKAAYLTHQNASWKEANKDLYSKNGHKAHAIGGAQWILLGAIFCAAVLTITAAVT